MDIKGAARIPTLKSAVPLHSLHKTPIREGKRTGRGCAPTSRATATSSGRDTMDCVDTKRAQALGED